MHLLKSAGICLLTLFAVSVIASPVAAATKNSKYDHIYYSIVGTYKSLQHISDAHNGFAKAHSPKCGQPQANKWWEWKYRKEVASVRNAAANLKTVSNKQKHTTTYKNFVQAFNDLTHWMNKNFEPRLLTCQSMPKYDYYFESDLQNLDADLGLPTY